MPETVVAHLDKSHICVHTYPKVILKAVYVPSAPILKSLPARDFSAEGAELPDPPA